MTLRNKKWNHLFSVTSYNKQRLSTAAVRIPCICWLMAIQAWVDFRHHPLWVTAKLAYSFCGRIPVPRFISPVSQSSVHTALHRKSQIKFISSLQNWVLRVGFCNHHILFPSLAEPGGLREGDPWHSRDWVFLKMDRSDSEVCAVKIVFIAKGNRIHSQIEIRGKTKESLDPLEAVTNFRKQQWS